MIRAVILLGGPSRKASYGTYEHASPLFPVCGIEIIGHLMNAIRKLHNLKDFVLMGYYDKKCFQHFQDKQQRLLGVTVSYIQEESELGTGGGLAQNIEQLFNEVDDLLVIHSDICSDLSVEEFYNFHKKYKKQYCRKQATCSIMTVRVSKEESTKYGCLIKDTETDQLIHHAEKPEKYISNLVNCGVYLFNAGFKKSILSAKEKKETSLSDELVHKPYVKFIKRSTDLNAKYISLENDVFKQMDREQVYLYEHNGFWQSIKSTQELLKANELLLQYYSQYPFNWSNTEYELQDKNVLIHKSARVHPSAKLGNNVVIGAGCEIGEGVRIKDSLILDGVEIKVFSEFMQNYSYISNSVICYNSIIGYWCRIEGGTQFLGPCVTVDNELYLRDVVCLQNARVLQSQEGGCVM